ncbi:ComEA family DNA-binding protein [Simiduia agarivorans]|uniref:Phospholipase D n=1 Tax=Simiduia agarivorans (strain DSM 21679 / JCM 13881 / BCRC 17597 / SA1) TaxID=1117647 RepID=K4KI88_SIMAS|nr:helix-hairpin-helix domain-containing protein [Simiduia agarivorans]AFU98864.1 phospholipase D [Simiduia agarivorans SA1 = DSM 21679]
MSIWIFIGLLLAIGYLVSRLRFLHLAHADDLRDLRAEIASLRRQLQQAPTAVPEAPLINLNTANKTTLQRIPKVGAACAKRIMDARPIESMDQLQAIEGLTEEQRNALRTMGCI